MALPFVKRALQFDLMVEGSSMCWEKTPYAEAVLSSSVLQWDKVGPCQCHRLPDSMTRWQGHVVTRAWDTVPCCQTLKKVAGGCSLQCRTYPGLDAICERFADRTLRFMQMGGFSDDDASLAQSSIAETTRKILTPWLMSLSPVMQQKELVKGRRDIWAGGMVLLKVDRSPGRVIVACREVFGILQKATFLENQRYAALDLVPSAEDDSFAQTIRASFKEAVPGCEQWIGRRPSGGSNRRAVTGLSSNRVC